MYSYYLSDFCASESDVNCPKKGGRRVLAAKQSPHRPGILQVLGLRAWSDDLDIVPQISSIRELPSSFHPHRRAVTGLLENRYVEDPV